MQILLIPENNGKVCQSCLSPKKVWMLGVLLLFVLPVISALGAWYFTASHHQQQIVSSQSDAFHVASSQQLLSDYQQRISDIKRQSTASMDALSMQLGRLQAQLMRSNALGQRLAEMAGLEKSEFDFSSEPALGGPAATISSSLGVPDFLNELDSLAEEIEQEQMELSLLESLMLDKDLQQILDPTGWPVSGGYISSSYGYRNDPFSGKKAFHKGVDIPASVGTAITSLAAGMVVFSGEKQGFGSMVEVDHGNGYVTRYAHVSRLSVNKGDRVDKGQKLAEIGSSGRSTGPHLHLEMLKDGKTINPRKRLYRASRSTGS